MIRRRPDEEDLYSWDLVPGAKSVCGKCFDDYALRKFVDAQVSAPRCSYCGRRSRQPGLPIAADINTVIEFIVQGLEVEWNDPAGELPYESREGGYLGHFVDTQDLIEGIGFVENENLAADIAGAIRTTHWCKRDYFGVSDSQALLSTWRRFTEVVKHQSRYLFFDQPKDDLWGPPEIPLAQMLDRLGNVVRNAGIVASLPKGASLWRARIHEKSSSFGSPEELGPPRIELARSSNRMSPAGIVMFYGATKSVVALAETSHSQLDCPVATTARWDLARELTILDLSKPMPLPSIFDETRRHLRQAILFLQDFVKDLSTPIDHDGREHCEYAPTQVVTEYFRRRFRTESGIAIDGIFYPSARYRGGVCCVLFCDRDHCVEPDSGDKEPRERWLVMSKRSVRRRRLG